MFLVGICTGLVGVTVDFLVEIFSKIKYSLIAKSITECTSEGCLWKPLSFWIGSNIGFTLLSVLLVVFLAVIILLLKIILKISILIKSRHLGEVEYQQLNAILME